MTIEQVRKMIAHIIEEKHLRDPMPVQYGFWIQSLLKGDWGWSGIMQEDVLEMLNRRAPVTIELTLYSLLLFIPMSLISGVISGARQRSRTDTITQMVSFIFGGTPTFILAILLIAVFYVWLHILPLERIGPAASAILHSESFHQYTGINTLDGLLNGSLTVFFDGLQHLLLPVVSLSLIQWATLHRVIRISTIEQTHEPYIVAAQSRGVPRSKLIWRHIFKNILSPAFTSSAISAASLFTGVLVIEMTFNLKGISELILSILSIPDTPLLLGFAVYSVVYVLAIIFILDVVQAMVDPRVREGIYQG